MAKNSTIKSGGPARVRLVVLDAVVPDGDFDSLAQVLQNALKPATGAQRQVITNGLATKAIAHQPAADESHEEELIEEVNEQELEDVTPVEAKVKKPRKPGPKPDIIPIDIESEPALSTLGKFKSHHKAYLAIATWLHDHRATPVISVDHVYTCYRHLNWPINLSDFAKPFRELKFRQFFTQPESGKYAINQLGIAKAAEAD